MDNHKVRNWWLVGIGSVAAAAAGAFWYQAKMARERRERRMRKRANNVNIGAVFGMDVGGTLAKVVYFERDLPPDAPSSSSSSSHRSPEGETRKSLLEEPMSPGGGEAGGHARSRPRSGSLVRHDKQQGTVMESLSPPAPAPVPPAAPAPASDSSSSSDKMAQLDAPDHQAALKELSSLMDNTRANNSTTSTLLHDTGMSFYSSALAGHLHFFYFETKNMVSAVDTLAGQTEIAENIRTIGCTGGGAVKFAQVVDEQMDIKLEQMDELVALMRGMHFALTSIQDECYTYRRGSGESPAPVSQPTPEDATAAAPAAPAETAADDEKVWQKDIKEYTHKTEVPMGSFVGQGNGKDSSQFPYPYLVVNIGSGVSILKITGPGKHERVSGSSVGGGTYWGLCRLLVEGATSYEALLDLAEAGDAESVDMLVKDIYGGGYLDSGLSGSMVASSFGKLVAKENPRENVKPEDLAIALLMMITNNIGQVAYLNARVHNCSKIVFVGSFLRHNQISCRRLAFAIDFWSKGTQEALFLKHEGYFGALGTFLQSAFGERDVDRVLDTFRTTGECSYNSSSSSSSSNASLNPSSQIGTTGSSSTQTSGDWSAAGNNSDDRTTLLPKTAGPSAFLRAYKNVREKERTEGDDDNKPNRQRTQSTL